MGKTSIIHKYIYNTFSNDYSVLFHITYKATIGIDFVSKQMEINNQTIKMQIWDTAGQERFRNLIPHYLRDCQIAIIVYDITSNRI